MPIIPEIRDHLDELTQIRRDIHAHPEIGFEEERTADIVAAVAAAKPGGGSGGKGGYTPATTKSTSESA